MRTYEFTIIATGLDPQADGFADRFFDAGCDDATISFQKGVIILAFAREAKNFIQALASAVLDVLKAGAKVERVEPDCLVSLSDIARRSNMTRAAVCLYAAGERAKNFPCPVARVTSESPLWDWVGVSRWMFHYRKLALEVVVQARLVRQVNAAISFSSSRVVWMSREPGREYAKGGHQPVEINRVLAGRQFVSDLFRKDAYASGTSGSRDNSRAIAAGNAGWNRG